MLAKKVPLRLIELRGGHEACLAEIWEEMVKACVAHPHFSVLHLIENIGRIDVLEKSLNEINTGVICVKNGKLMVEL
jgi:hypothetical protein